jgi:hypothetical protein
MIRFPHFDKIVKRFHRVYKEKEISPVLDYLTTSELPRGAITNLASQTGIPHQTLTRWHQERTAPDGAGWFPLQNGHPNKRTLPDSTEAAICEHLRHEYFQNGIGATRMTLQALAQNAFGSLDTVPHEGTGFAASSRYARNFENRWALSLRLPHAERRTNVDLMINHDFAESLRGYRQRFADDHIFNCDETSWNIQYGPRRVLYEKGAPTVKLVKRVGDKQSVTAIGTISLQGQKLPLWVIAKGKSQTCEKKYGYHPSTVFAHTENGWTTEELYKSYLRWLSAGIRGEPCLLVADMYQAHRTQGVKDLARELGIELLFVPAGATGECQPLDRRIFGELKSLARSEFVRQWSRTASRETAYSDAVTILEYCWSNINAENIRRAWQIA